MRKLYKFSIDFCRYGNLEGVFIADKKEVEKIMNKTTYFGEVLGKHSDICVDFDEDNLKVVSEDQDFINKMESVFGTNTISGYNPLHYHEDYDGDDYSDEYVGTDIHDDGQED